MASIEPMRWVLALAMFGAGVTHFTNSEFFLAIMPPFIPWHLAMVYISGVAEMGLAVGVLLPATRNLAAWGLVALYLAVYPANIYMAVSGAQPAALGEMPAWAAWARLPLQFVFIYWAYRYTDRFRERSAVS